MNRQVPSSIAELVLVRLAIVRAQRAANVQLAIIARMRAQAEHQAHQADTFIGRMYLVLAIGLGILTVLTVTTGPLPLAAITVPVGVFSILAARKLYRRAGAAAAECRICYPPCDTDPTTG